MSMQHGRKSQVIPVILIVVIVVVSVAAIVALARTLFFDSDVSDNSQQQQEASVTALLDTSPDRGVRMTVRGEIIADEEFRSYQIDINPNYRSMTTYSGYLDTPIDSVKYNNNIKAYEQFVYALHRADMVAGSQLEGKADDVRGICAGGKVLEFETTQNSKTVKHLWTTTCKGIEGSLAANSSYLGNLFMKQIPASQELLSKIHKS